jgi:hypothetical protein
MYFLLVFVLLSLMAARLAAAQAIIDDDESAFPVSGAGSRFSVDGGLGLRRYLLQRYKRGLLSATDVCTLAWHSTQAGAEGVADLALHPDSSSGNFSKHLKRALKMRAASTFYCASVPMWDKDTETRYEAQFPMNLPHDIFAAEFIRDPSSFDTSNFDLDEVPAHFFDHVVTKESGRCVPLGYFSDAVPFTNKDSFVSYYLSNVLTGQRFFYLRIEKVRSVPVFVFGERHVPFNTTCHCLVIQLCGEWLAPAL